MEFDPAVDSEIRKTCPAVIVSNDAANRNLARVVVVPLTSNTERVNRPDFPGECFICELRLPDHCFRWKHNELFLLLPEEYGPA
ncbi:type II toxin-antitoxin system PemK/MazF family toxin, partial [Escherichia coli]